MRLSLARLSFSSPVNFTSNKRLRATNDRFCLLSRNHYVMHHNMSKNIIAVLLLLLAGSFKHVYASEEAFYQKAMKYLDKKMVEWSEKLEMSKRPDYAASLLGSLANSDEVKETLKLMSLHGSEVLFHLEKSILDSEQLGEGGFFFALVPYQESMSPMFLLYAEKQNVLLEKACQVWSAQATAFLTADSLVLTPTEQKYLVLALDAVEGREKIHHKCAKHYSDVAQNIPWSKFREVMNALSERLTTITVDVAKPHEYLRNMANTRLHGLPRWIATSSIPPVKEMSIWYILAMVQRHEVCVQSIQKELDLYHHLLDEGMETKQRKKPGLWCFRSHCDEDDFETSARIRRAIETQIVKLKSDLISTDNLLHQYEAALDERYDAERSCIKTVSSEFNAPGSSRNNLSHDGIRRRGAGSSKSIGH
ncbi:hypothetical protein SeLEV6574_g02329 [Synchytrium endobioticum]|uniref:Uncharacterized protein n=1 Tax=Synchytrium endobioticum TaxID=286115 RepID=A0A507D938_9FUNG|nr:hypothetical protein SeLEV6574_g02329 [Synchytrium endobioticum]